MDIRGRLVAISASFLVACGGAVDYRRFKKLTLSIPGSVFSDLDQCASTQGVASLSAQLSRP